MVAFGNIIYLLIDNIAYEQVFTPFLTILLLAFYTIEHLNRRQRYKNMCFDSSVVEHLTSNQ